MCLNDIYKTVLVLQHSNNRLLSLPLNSKSYSSEKVAFFSPPHQFPDATAVRYV